MNNHIHRHGLIPNKTVDGRRWIRVFTKPRSAADNEKTTISHKGRYPGTCGFHHAPYGSSAEYTKESASEVRDYFIWTTLAKFSSGAAHCSFCRIIWQGLQRYRFWWEMRWNLLHHLEAHTSEYDLNYDSCFNEHLLSELDTTENPVDARKIYVRLSFSSKTSLVEARLIIEANKTSPNVRNRLLMALEFHTIEGKPSQWYSIGHSPQVSTDVLSQSSVKKLKQWIGDCVENHSLCGAVTNKVHPEKLIHVQRAADATKLIVRVCEVKSNQKYEFIALSHCWKNSKPVKTTRQNLSEGFENLDWDELPEVFKDTFRLSLLLGTSYVWIDSLCIAQGDEEDRPIESPEMAAIYASAQVVFAAHGPTLCLEKNFKKCIPARFSASVTEAIVEDPNVIVRPKIDHDKLVNPSEETESWLGRAWCFQERLFGSRILHFGGRWGEVTFECNINLRCECGGVDQLQKDSTGSNWNHQKSSFWRTLRGLQSGNEEQHTKQIWRNYTSLCETYTSQGLSFSGDTLMALHSLAEQVSPKLGRYYAGLWEYNLIIDLQWESLDGRRSHRHGSYVAPSFSWASRTGPALWYIYETYLKRNNDECDFAEILDINCETAPGKPFGRVTGGYIKLRGFTCTMHFSDERGCYDLGKLKIVKHNPAAVSKENAQENNDERTSGCFVCMDAIEDMLEARGKPVTCLDIMRDKWEGGYVSALVLVPAVDGGQTFRRVGFTTMDKSFFKDTELTDVSII